MMPTTRPQTERSWADLYQSERLYRLIVRNLPGTAISVFDKSLRYVLAEGPFFSMLQISPETLLGKTLSEVFSPGVVELLLPFYRAALEGQQSTWDRNVQGFSYSGRVVPVYDDNNQIYGGMAIVQDVTAQRNAERALRESELRYRSLFENSLDAVFLTDPSGPILMANPAACRMFGRSEEEIIALGRAGVIDTNDPHLTSVLEERERTGAVHAELRGLRSDGSTFPLEMSSKIFEDVQHQLKTSMIVRDITERKAAEQQALELRIERERSRLLSDFLRNLSHNIRTRMSVIASSVYLLDKATDEAQHTKQIERLRGEVARLQRTFDEMLTISELDSTDAFEFAAVQPGTLIEEVIVYLSKQAEEQQVTLLSEVAPGLPAVSADGGRLKQALAHIVEKSIIYAPSGGEVMLRTYQDDSTLTVEIYNNGLVVSKEDLPHLFEPFYLADRVPSDRGESSGLGLPMAHMIVERHGGTIEVESDEKNGSIFRICLPLNHAN